MRASIYPLVLVLSVACGGETEVDPITSEVRGPLVPATTYAVPATWNSDHVQPGVVGTCYLSSASDRLFAGTVTDVVGPVIPQDPCDSAAYRFVRPHYEIAVQEKSGQSTHLVWLDKEARPSDLVVGDELVGGLRELDGQNFLQRFVIVNPQRGERLVQATLPDVAGGEVPTLESGCASKMLADEEFRDVIHAAPDVSCGMSPAVPYRASGEVDDETQR